MRRPFRVHHARLVRVARWLCVGILLWLVLLAGERIFTPRLELETVADDAAFTVRSTEAFTVAQVHLAGTYAEAFTQGVAILDRYREGENLRQPIEIVTVRGQTHERSERFGRRFPYILQQEDGGTLVSLILPEGLGSQSAPRPEDPRIRIRTVPSFQFAVRTIPRSSLAENVQEEEAAFRDLIAAQGYHVGSGDRVAVYDFTWTPAWLERTELWIPVAPVY